MKAYASWRRLIKVPILVAWLSTMLVAGLLPLGALAANYGSGSYGGCAYNTGCATSKIAATPAADTAPATPGNILLNEFSDYFATGKELTLSAGQVVYFDITRDGVIQHHSITIKDIGSDYVDIVITSDPITDRLSIGQTKSYDVTGDGQANIEITLKTITNGQAVMIFRALTATVAAPATTPGPSSHHLSWWLLIGLFGLCLIIGIWLFIWLWKRRRHNHRPTTNQPL